MSSHLIADLEHRCDYLVVLSASRVQVLGDVDDLLATHAVLVGPSDAPEPIAGVGAVVSESRTDRQRTLFVRTDGERSRPHVDDTSGRTRGPRARLPQRTDGRNAAGSGGSGVIWLAWRQRRGTIVVALVALATIAAILVLTGRQMSGSFHGDGLAACIERLRGAAFVPVDGGCQDQAAAFASRFFMMRLLGLTLFTFAPLVLGMFWGAPVVAREVEQDTVSLAWTQGVTRRRWTWTQLAVVGAMTLIATGVFASLVTWWYGPLNAATGDRFQWLIYDQQGLAPVGYALFAVSLAAFLGRGHRTDHASDGHRCDRLHRDAVRRRRLAAPEVHVAARANLSGAR